MTVYIDPHAIHGAQLSMVEWGPPASVALAQYGTESAWGRYEPPGSNNGFGIQALPGLPWVEAASHEFRGGVLVPVMEKFAKFESVEDAFIQHAKLLATDYVYVPAMAVKANWREFCHALLGRYATAPNYDMALINLIQEDQLYNYDVSPGFETPVMPSVVKPLLQITTVKQLQVYLNMLLPPGRPKLDVDGLFGVHTRGAVAWFQGAHSLFVDGDPGPNTDAAIIAAIPKVV